jgi:FMN phosphatase YigB (HAD superfamily)
MKIVSFDFDGTLEEHFDGGKNKNREGIQQLFQELVDDDGFDVYIITRRFGPEHASKGIGQEHQKVYDLLNSLNIVLAEEKILFTNRDYKYSFIHELGVDIHLDDEIRERELIDKYTSGSSVDSTQPNWREKFDELL